MEGNLKESERRVDPEKVLAALGRFNRYSIFVYVIVTAQYIMMAWQLMSMIFAQDTPPFKCVAQETSINGSTFDNQCTIGRNSSSPVPCGQNGTYFNYSASFGKTIVSEWDINCEKSWLSQLPTSAFMAGMLFGGISMTQMSDWFGRRWTFMLNIWAVPILGILTSFSTSFPVFVALRFLCGFAIEASSMVGWILVCETIVVELRSWAGVIPGTFWTTGYCILGLIAFYVRDWRNLYLVVSIPVLLTVGYYWAVPESLHWLVAQNKTERTKQWILNALRFNGKKQDYEYFLLTCPGTAMEEKRKKRSLIDIFKIDVMAVQTLLMAFMWITNAFVYYGLSFFSIKLGGDKYTNYVLMGLAEFPAMVFTSFFLHIFGRRLSASIFFSLSGVSLLTLAFLPATAPTWAGVLLSMVGKYAITTCYYCSFIYVAEIFPTTVRTVGSGFCAMSSRISSILAPNLATLANPRHPPLIFGLLSVLSAIFALALPETKGIVLVEDIHEARTGPLMEWVHSRRKQRAPELREMLETPRKTSLMEAD